MNKLSKKQTLCNLLLLSALLAPGLAQADESTTAAVQTMDGRVTSGIGDVKGAVDNVKGSVDASKDVLQKILDKHDISSKEMVNALINYWAKESINAYAYDQEKLFQVAPGSLWATKAGSQAGILKTAEVALTVAMRSLINSIGSLSDGKEPITILGITIDLKENPPLGYIQLYAALKPFFETGNTESLKNINIGAMLQSTVLDDTNDAVDGTTKYRPSQTLVNILTNPFPVRDAQLAAKMKSGNLTGDDMEAFGQVVSQYALVGVSANAWADIIARRTPPTGSSPDGSPGKSVMQIMEQTAKDRFTSKDWYAAIGTASEAALLREIAHMMAYNQWVQYQQFRMSEQQVSLLASMNGVMAKVNASMDSMTAQMEKAQAEAKVEAAKAKAEAEAAKKEAEAEAERAKEAAESAPTGG